MRAGHGEAGLIAHYFARENFDIVLTPSLTLTAAHCNAAGFVNCACLCVPTELLTENGRQCQHDVTQRGFISAEPYS